jgi:hypothetical protein
VVTNRVNQFADVTGSTPKATLEQFCKRRPWFRPVDEARSRRLSVHRRLYNRIISHYELPTTRAVTATRAASGVVYRGPDGMGNQPRIAIYQLKAAELVGAGQHQSLCGCRRPTGWFILAGMPRWSREGDGDGLGTQRRMASVLQTGKLEPERSPSRERIPGSFMCSASAEIRKLSAPIATSALRTEGCRSSKQPCAREALGAHPVGQPKPLLELRHRVDGKPHCCTRAWRCVTSFAGGAVAGLTSPSSRKRTARARRCRPAFTRVLRRLYVHLNRFGGSRASCRTHAAVRYGAGGGARRGGTIATKFNGDLATQGQLLKVVQQASQESGRALASETTFAKNW